jgi:hypothetical protein
MNKARGTCLHKIIEIEFDNKSFEIRDKALYNNV